MAILVGARLDHITKCRQRPKVGTQTTHVEYINAHDESRDVHPCVCVCVCVCVFVCVLWCLPLTC